MVDKWETWITKLLGGPLTVWCESWWANEQKMAIVPVKWWENEQLGVFFFFFRTCQLSKLVETDEGSGETSQGGWLSCHLCTNQSWGLEHRYQDCEGTDWIGQRFQDLDCTLVQCVFFLGGKQKKSASSKKDIYANSTCCRTYITWIFSLLVIYQYCRERFGVDSLVVWPRWWTWRRAKKHVDVGMSGMSVVTVALP